MAERREPETILDSIGRLDVIPIQDKINAISFVLDFPDNKAIDGLIKGWKAVLEQNVNSITGKSISKGERDQILSFLTYIDQFKEMKKSDIGKKVLADFKEILELCKRMNISVEAARDRIQQNRSQVQQEREQDGGQSQQVSHREYTKVESKIRQEMLGPDKAPTKFEFGEGPFHEQYSRLSAEPERKESKESKEGKESKENLERQATSVVREPSPVEHPEPVAQPGSPRRPQQVRSEPPEQRRAPAPNAAAPFSPLPPAERPSPVSPHSAAERPAPPPAAAPSPSPAKPESKEVAEGPMQSLFTRLRVIVGINNEEILLHAIEQGKSIPHINAMRDTIASSMNLKPDKLKDVSNILQEIHQKSWQFRMGGGLMGTRPIKKPEGMNAIIHELISIAEKMHGVQHPPGPPPARPR